MKFVAPWLAPYIDPAIKKIVTFFWGPQAAEVADVCPIRPKETKPKEATSSDTDDQGISKKDQ